MNEQRVVVHTIKEEALEQFEQSRLIRCKEALQIFEHTPITLMGYVMKVAGYYKCHSGINLTGMVGFLSMLAFIYNTGVIQGKREERARHKAEMRDARGEVY